MVKMLLVGRWRRMDHEMEVPYKDLGSVKVLSYFRAQGGI